MKTHLKLVLLFLFTSIHLSYAQVDVDSTKIKEFNKLIDSISQLRKNRADPETGLALCRAALKMAEEEFDDPLYKLKIYNKMPYFMLLVMDQEAIKEYLMKGGAIADKLEDSVFKSDYYKGCCRYYQGIGNRDSLVFYNLKNIKILEVINDSVRLAGAYDSYASASSSDSMLYYFRKALDIRTVLKDTAELAKSYGNIGTYYLAVEDDLEKTIEYISASNECFLSIGNEGSLSVGYYILALVYSDMASYDEAIEYGQKSLELKNKTGDLNGIIQVNDILGDIHSNLGRHQDALNYYYQGKSQALAISSDLPLLAIYESLAIEHFDHDLDSSAYYYNQSLDLSKRMNHSVGEANAKVGLGEVFSKQEKFELAESYLLDGLDLLQESGYESSIKPSLLSLTELYLVWFEKSENTSMTGPDLNNVENILGQYEETLETEESYISKKRLYKNYTNLFKARKNYKQQSVYQSKLVALQDSFIVNRNIEVANEYAEKLKTSEKEKEIIALEAKNKIASFRNTVFSYALGGTILFFGLLFYLFRRFTKIRQRENQLKENQNFRTRLSRNLHDDVSSMLNSLAMQTELAAMQVSPDKKSTFDDIVIKSRQAVQNMRDTVWAIDSSKDKYENLLDRIVDYAEENLSLKNFELDIEKYNWKKDQNILPEHRQNIYLIFKEAITNILKHSKGDHVKIGIGFKQNNFVLDIHNNGAVERIKKSGVGTKSMKRRAIEIGGVLSFNHDDGFKVNLKMPLV
jgi:signal transduction histidine kinase/tetratricopeptide (TPR) repeat protein